MQLVKREASAEDSTVRKIPLGKDGEGVLSDMMVVTGAQQMDTDLIYLCFSQGLNMVLLISLFTDLSRTLIMLTMIRYLNPNFGEIRYSYSLSLQHGSKFLFVTS